ncbi:hypothetical protein E2562_014331 [Oryza meyeriana var. granulata]|uniref:Uncharacterized protein n=1 Tax=Oryza meyeriana var. granulata TaxID=110450 RepID=A0A6G1C6B2_9ORYZ|nr:hypothetical protein E2562_014331 [Oryza meyeriana var. granulata]
MRKLSDACPPPDSLVSLSPHFSFSTSSIGYGASPMFSNNCLLLALPALKTKPLSISETTPANERQHP